MHRRTTGGAAPRRPAARVAWLVAGLVALAACGDASGPRLVGGGPAPRPSLSQLYRPSGMAAAGYTMVHLFEWPWNDIASECETVLGPAGVWAVQVSPPQEHSVQASGTWSERYQPVSYSVANSRSGTGAEFQAMVTRCKNAGVGIIVDAVINHMTNVPSPGVGSNGTAYTKYSYPGLYAPSDFHAPCTVTDYNDAANVQDCELFGLPDLNTGLASVRAKIAAYLTGLARLGVLGFRVDAAKHIQQVELDAIIAQVNADAVADGRPRPYVFLEVVGGGNEAVQKADYFGVGYASGGAADITEFTFTGVSDKFRNLGAQRLFQLNPAGTPGNQFSPGAWGMIASDKALVFLENHDTQRTGTGVWYQDGQLWRLATAWMLAYPYGLPSVLSGYAFSRSTQPGRELGPPSDANGKTLPVTCAASLEVAAVGQFACEHRDAVVRAMVRFRRVTAGADVNHWWDNSNNAIAFTRGTVGFVAINREAAPITTTIATGLPAGTWCDVITGGLTSAGTACAGTALVVNASGQVTLTIPANGVLAVHAGARP